MDKNIKKSLKYFIILIGIIITLPTLLYLILRIPEVQTLAVKRITNHLSHEIQSTISIGRIEYVFFNRLIISDLLIEDQYRDTLIYSNELRVSIRRINLKTRSYRLGKVSLMNPEVSFVTDSAGRMNLTWYLDMLKLPADSTKVQSSFTIDQIEISNARFSMVNQIKKESKSTIDFNNLKFSGINAIIENFRVADDTTSFDVYNLGLVGNGGFRIRKLSSSVALANQSIMLNSVFIHADSSMLNLSKLEIRPDSLNSFQNFTEEVRLDIEFEESLINTSDLKYFIPFENNTNETIWLSGRIFGTISELRGRNINIAYREKTRLDSDFDFSGLPNIENTFMYFGINSLITNARDIENFEMPGKGKIKVPEVLYRLGDVSFDGSFTGFTTDFVTYGKITTDLGNIRTDISLRPEAGRYRIKGLIDGSNIDLGRVSGNTKLLGNLSMEANIDGYASSLEKFAANLTGKIDSVEINRYTYRDIELKGYFTEKTWDGNVNIEDVNIKMDLMGMFNFSGELPEFDFTLNLSEANLHKLNFDAKDTTSSLTLLLTSNFRGNNIDNLDGEIRLLNSRIRKYGTDLDLYDFSIRTYTENREPVLSLRTDFADADLKGYYSFSGLGELFKSTLARFMPTLNREQEKKSAPGRNNFTFSVNFKNTDKINDFFRTGLHFSDKSYFNGIISTDSIIRITGNAKSFEFKNNIFHDINLDANITGEVLSADVNTSSLTFMGQTNLKGFSVNFDARPDNFDFSVNWDNKEQTLNKGRFAASGNINRHIPGLGNPIISVKIDSSDIYIRNNLWKVKQSEVIVDSNAIKINKVNIVSNDRYYQVDGAISEDPSDTLRLRFKGIDISPLNYIRKKDAAKTSSLPLNLRGTLNGNIFLTNIYKNLLLETNVRVDSFSILNSNYGNISVVSAWDAVKRVVNIDAGNNLNGLHMFDISGFYDPSSKKIDIDLLADKLPIGALNPLLKIFASDISGLVSGKVKLSGGMNNLTLNGAVMAQNASIKIDYLQSKYILNDTVRFDKNGIKFNTVKLTDQKGNNATLNGYVYHKNFKNYSTDLVVNTNQFQALNTKPKDNELFYGTAYATGVTTIKIDEKTIGFDISARTDKNTKFFIPLTSGLSVSEYSFISFINPDSARNANLNIVTETKPTGMDLNFDLEVTPDAEVKLIFDAKVGDEMTGVGSGDLNINLDQQGNFKISGDYIIEKGDYLFTLGNILNKSFDVENGGRITFNGDIDNAEIDITANYGLTTSLYQILDQDEKYKERTNVKIQLNLSGKLFNPVVKLAIDLPNADEATKSYLKSKITTDEELNRQFFYLLVMNSFLATNTSTSGSSAMAVTTTEMLSNQISNWLSQISSDVDLGFVYRPGDKNVNSQELEVALSTQLLNDKVLINFRGTGSSGQSSETNQISGDFDAEVKITEKIRFKVFNRYNNPYTGKQADYTQGIGLFYQQEFSRFSDLFRKKSKSDMKKEEIPVVEKP